MNKLLLVEGLKKDVKDALMSLHDMVIDTAECLEQLQTSFICDSSVHVRECRKRLEGLGDAALKTSRKITELADEDPGLKLYISIPHHLTVIRENVEKLMDLVERKIKEGILFSQKAVDETTFLIQRLIELLKPVSDIILARNAILINYVKESERDISSKALEYATLHEERLIGGVCQPVASSVYLSMLDAIKAIAWHAKQIAMKLA